jgi:hypothetical protein
MLFLLGVYSPRNIFIRLHFIRYLPMHGSVFVPVAMTFSITTFSIMTFSVMTLSITTFSIMTLRA